MTTAREIHLTAYPEGEPKREDFALVERELPAPSNGEVLGEVLVMSVDPYMRGRMNPHRKSYIPPFELNEALDGGAVVRVLESRAEGFAPGDVISGMTGAGWRSHAVFSPKGWNKVDISGLKPAVYLGVLGMPGLTAWAGLTQIIAPKEGEAVFVSGAAGAVGSLVCQLAAQKGARVFGSAGSQAKIDWLVRTIGCDAAFNYKEHDARSLSKALAEVAPDGVHGFFDNVGGMQLEALLDVMATGGRIAECGMISQYNATEPPAGPSNIVNVITRELTIKGFIVSSYAHLTGDFIAEVAPLVAAGKIAHEETVYEGLETAPDAFLGLFRGENTGKAVVKIAD